jgi:MFS family permease
MLKQHPLVKTLFSMKGNSRACVLTEPLWGIPFNLYGPYVSIYMYTLGVTDRQIGLISSIFMISQILFSLLGGIITDKLGRRRTTFYFDMICWSIPCLIWAFSQSFIYFAIAAVFNGVFRVTSNSWGCLLVEDADKDQIVNMYTWIYIFSQCTAFFSPIGGFFVGNYGLVTAVRGFYIFSLIMMTTKFVLTYKFSTETAQGKVRMQETKHVSMFKMLHGYGGVLKQILKTPETLLTLGLMLVMSIVNMINGTFWSLMVTENLHVSEKSLGIFPFIRSAIMLIFFFTVIPRIHVSKFKQPMLFGFCLFIVSQLILITTPEKNYVILIISILLEVTSISFISPLLDSLMVVMIDPKERARIIALFFTIIPALTSPFGYISGIFSGIDRRIPFLLNIALLFIGLILTYFAAKVSNKKPIAASA